MFKLNPFTGEFDQVGGILVESLPTNFLANSVIFSDGSTLVEDNPGFTYIPGTGLSLDDDLNIKGQIFVDGDTDQIQLLVQAHSTQNSLLAVWEDSSGNNQITFSGTGAAFFNVEGNDADFRISSQSITNALFLNGLTGFLGLNNAFPAHEIEITGSNTGPTIEIEDNNIGSGAFARLLLDTNSSDFEVTMHGSGRTGVSRWGFTIGGWAEIIAGRNSQSFNGLVIGTNSSDPVLFGTNNIERMRVQAGGDVIIQSNNNANMFVVDAGIDEVLIGRSTGLTAALGITPHATTDAGIIIQAIASQTGPFITFENSSAVELFQVEVTGRTQISRATNSIIGSNVDVSNLGFRIHRSQDTNNRAVGIGFSHSTVESNVGAAIIHERTGGTSVGDLHFATKSVVSSGADIPIRMTLTSTGILRVLSEVEIDGALNHDGSTIGFFGTTPAVQVAAYTPTNVSTDRAYDANATTIDELADILGTLIADLQTYGLLQ